MESALGGPAHLTAFVAYLRTPGDTGGRAHCDYKRWRPVGSSMNWAFAIIPLNDFDAEYGPFLVSPKSHHLAQVIDPRAHVLDLTAPDARQLPPFIDPELRAGDLLVVNEHVWHEAPPGTTGEDRCGIFHKYCAANAPPAAGYYPYNPAALDALSDTGKRLLPVCFDKPIATTRLLLECPSGDESRFLLRRDADTDRWELPGGAGWEEQELVGWDVGARIGSLQALVNSQLGLEVPWMSYIEDIAQEEGACRVYGFSDEEVNVDELANGDNDWFTLSELQRTLGEGDAICRTVDTWLRGDIVRGRGQGVPPEPESIRVTFGNRLPRRGGFHYWMGNEASNNQHEHPLPAARHRPARTRHPGRAVPATPREARARCRGRGRRRGRN